MDTIRKHVRQARWRLVLEQFLHRLLFCLWITLAIAVVGIVVPKLFVLDSLPSSWDILWLGGAAVAAVLIAAFWTIFRHRDELDAAMEIDRRYDLKERVASSLFLSTEDTHSRAGQALVQDTIRRIDRLDISEHFRVGLGRRPWLPLLPAILAVGLIVFVNDRTQPAKATAESPLLGQQIRKQVKASAEILRKKIDQKKKEAVQKGLKDAENLFHALEKGTHELTKKEGIDRKQAAIKLNDLAKQIEERRKKMGDKDTFKNQFEKLNKIDQGPATRIADALNRGDMNQAIGEIQKLQEKIAQGELDQEEKEKLAEQLGAMAKQLAKAADNHKEAMENLQKQIEDQKRLGNTQNAAKLQEQLDRLVQNQPQMDQLRQLAAQLGQCQNNMEQGNSTGAAQAMQQLAQQLEQMQEHLDEMEMLEDAVQQIGEAKNAMGCQQCQGEGCEACMGQLGMGSGKGKKKGGMGMGEGQGAGPRPEEKNNSSFRDSHVGQKTTQGRAVVTGTSDGPNLKGSTREAIAKEINSGLHEAADPLASERLPRSRQEHAQEYYDRIRQGG